MSRINKKYFFMGLILVLWLSCANQIIVQLFVNEDKRPQKVDFETVKSNDKVFTSAISNSEEGGFYEEYSISGGAFCERKPGTVNTNRKVTLILRSENITYSIQTTNTPRPDLYEAYHERLKLYGGSLGFMSKFSTINIQNGLYELVLAVVENEDTFGWGETGWKYIKDENGFRPYLHCEVNNIADTVSAPEVKFRFDSVDLKDGMLNLSGWSIFNNTNAELNDVYLQITNENGIARCFEMRKSIRTDLAKIFETDNYLLSGISGCFEDINLSDGKYIFKIITKNEETYYISQEYELVEIEGGRIQSRLESEVPIVR